MGFNTACSNVGWFGGYPHNLGNLHYCGFAERCFWRLSESLGLLQIPLVAHWHRGNSKVFSVVFKVEYVLSYPFYTFSIHSVQLIPDNLLMFRLHLKHTSRFYSRTLFLQVFDRLGLLWVITRLWQREIWERVWTINALNLYENCHPVLPCGDCNNIDPAFSLQSSDWPTSRNASKWLWYGQTYVTYVKT